jgi:3',5'-cyclic AMP phosphodiesterase CpdA
MSIKIAVVSDLHCHHSSSAPAETILLTDSDRYPAKNHPISALQELITTRGLGADILLAPGDFTNKVDKQGLVSGWDFIQQISLWLNARTIAATPGNHDVMSRKPADDPFQNIRTLSPRFPTQQEDRFTKFWADGYCAFETADANIITINTVKSHTNEESAKRGLILPEQLASLDSYLTSLSKKKFNVAVCHHHPILHEDIGAGAHDVMTNGSELIETLARHGYHLIVHGHKHHPKLTQLTAPSPMVIFAAGSFSAAMKGGLATRTRNVFHIIDLDLTEHNEVRGQIKTWQFQLMKGWIPATTDAADFPHTAGFGSPLSHNEIADHVIRLYSAQTSELYDWRRVLETLPEIQHALPSTLRHASQLLLAQGIHLIPPPPDQPQVVGRI